uniref:Major facilitator superfamily (MFS) profile domain-containing protein n=1 Tax=Bionectria ochroleuca TaxID=29856 RepID=A0A8H7NHZ6_BIOOC
MSDMKKLDVQHVEPVSEHGNPAILAASSPAARFEHRQHSLSRVEAIKENKLPLAWCMYMFFICVAWGFDGLAGGVVVSIAEFRKDYGKPYGETTLLTQTGNSDSRPELSSVTMVFGGWMAGLFIDRVGRQPVIGAAFIISIGGVFLQVFSKNIGQFLGGKVLTGIPLGVFTTAAPPYASEMAPLAIRGSISAGMNFAIVLGQLIGYGVMRQASFYGDSRAYKVLFATQWGFAAVGIAILPFFPESPYWLVASGKAEKARKNLEKLHDADYDFDGHMAEINDSLTLQRQQNDSQGGCWTVLGKMPGREHYFQLAGMETSKSFDTTVGLCGMMVVGNICSWWFIDWFGRRSTAFYGCIALCITLFLIGILSVIKASGAVWGQVVFMAVWSFVYQATVGAVAWPIATEAATSRLRGPTQALATMVNGLSSSIWSMSLPYAINPDQGNLGGKIAFIFGSTLAISAVFIFFMIPETKGRTYIEIDELWARGIPPRKFKETELVTIPVEELKTVD